MTSQLDALESCDVPPTMSSWKGMSVFGSIDLLKQSDNLILVPLCRFPEDLNRVINALKVNPSAVPCTCLKYATEEMLVSDAGVEITCGQLFYQTICSFLLCAWQDALRV